MDKAKEFKTMYEAIQRDFRDYISDIKLYLKARDKEYKGYLESIAKIKARNRKIDLLEYGEITDFTREDFKDLQELISLHYKIQSKEEKAIFYGGVGNAVCLLREMDNLKKANGDKC